MIDKPKIVNCFHWDKGICCLFNMSCTRKGCPEFTYCKGGHMHYVMRNGEMVLETETSKRGRPMAGSSKRKICAYSIEDHIAEDIVRLAKELKMKTSTLVNQILTKWIDTEGQR